MKTYLNFVLVLALTVFIASCDSDDDGNAPALNPVVGSWQIVEIHQTVEENGTIVFDESFSTDVCNLPVFFTFVNGGQLTITEFELDFNFDFGGNISLDCNVEDADLNGGWELIAGNTYLVTIDGDSQQVFITFSDGNNSFQLAITNTETEDGDTYTETVTFTGNRV